ncbi:MAG: glycoside hydrolase family 88 protein [Clostridia bacterium]|nr:glycoside hydrolase family 88 protein [Clostridia bacterium]
MITINETASIEYTLNKIFERMILLRPITKVKAKAYYKGLYKQSNIHGSYEIDLKKLYPGAHNGQFVYVRTIIKADCDSKGILTLSSNAKGTFQGKRLEDFDKDTEDKVFKYNVNFKKGNNELIIKVYKDSGDFKINIQAGYFRYPARWSEDYLLRLKATIPDSETEEEGFSISKLYSDDNEDIEYIYPSRDSYYGDFDIYRLYSSNKAEGVTAYAVSVAERNCEIEIIPVSHTEIYVNKDRQTGYKLSLKKGDIVTVCTASDTENWGFGIKNDDNLSLSRFDLNEKWMIAGPFYKKDSKEDILEWICGDSILKKPYVNSKNEMIFWRLNAKNRYIRLYLDSKFFGQWFYAFMVGLYGIRKYERLFHNSAAKDYYKAFADCITDYYDYVKYDFGNFGSPHILSRAALMKRWDDIGTIGAFLIDAYIDAKDGKYMRVINDLELHIQNIITMPDGVYFRGNTMWADDLYMSMSFISRLYKITKSEKYKNIILNQVTGYRDKLFLPDENLFAHIYYPDKKRNNAVPWGRGNGWIMMALLDILEYAGDCEEIYNCVVPLLKSMVKGIINCQSDCGMWHQVLNRPESYKETSATAMFVSAISRGIQLKILDRKYETNVQKGLQALFNYAVSTDYDIDGVCLGSGCMDDAKYYFDIPTHKNDDHGVGLVLAAGCDYLTMISENN